MGLACSFLLAGWLTFAPGTTAADAAPPAVSIGDATVTEPDDDFSDVRAEFVVTLSSPSSETVTVDYMTEDGSATYWYGEPLSWDYDGRVGTVTFGPNDTQELVSFRIIGDTRDELDETFGVRLSNPANATIADGLGTGTIVDNDEPSLSASGSRRYEGSEALLTVSLSGWNARTVTVDYATEDGTATAGQDYRASSGTLTFAPGELSKEVRVPLLQDTAVESEERFGVRLSNASNASIGNALGEMLVYDDDLDELVIDDDDTPPDRARPRITIGGVKASRCVERAFTLRVRIEDDSSLYALRINLNGRKLHSSKQKRFSHRIKPSKLRRGRNKLTVIAIDKGRRLARRTVHFKQCP